MEAIDWEFGAKCINRTAEHTTFYADAVREVGAEMGIPVVDLWTRCMVGAGSLSDRKKLPGARALRKNEVLAGLLYDGLHLGPEGYRILFDEVMKVIAENWPDQVPEKLPTLGFIPWENSEFSWGVDAGEEQRI